ncbi:MAG: aminoglycoside phosphotransferase family protein [Desulfovibrionales bacterium]
MIQIDQDHLQEYLREVLGKDAELTGIGEIGTLDEQGMKDFGYGKPLLISYKEQGGEKQAVLSVMRGDKFGHQFYWDRAAILMFQYHAGARLKKHVRPLGLGYVDGAGRLNPVKDPQEYFIVNEKVEGKDYFQFLERIRTNGVTKDDLELAANFAKWLAEIHSDKKDDPDLYLRRTRQLIGDSECIWGLVDSYPYPYDLFPPERFEKLEKKLIEWRWKLRKYTGRLSATHGDFHPWNVLVREDNDFTVLDRSRGEWGEPADDVSTMSCNYFLFGLYASSRFGGDFEKLYLTFWDTYLDLTNDRQMLEVIAPYYVFRGLVIASPVWYPDHPQEVRQGLLRFLENVLQDDTFDYQNINKYME